MSHEHVSVPNSMTGPFFVLECVECGHIRTEVPTDMSVGEVLRILADNGFRLEVHYTAERERMRP